MTYDFKRLEEMAWVGLVAAGVVALEVLVRFDASQIESWETWAIGFASGMLRAAAGAVLGAITRPQP